MNNYKITEARKAKGWSQADLAKQLGTTQQQVARYESGENDVKSSVIVNMSRVLGVTISYLLGLEEDAEDHDYKLDRVTSNYMASTPEGKELILALSDAAAAQAKNCGGGASMPSHNDAGQEA